jgi:hypothetical protein
MNETIKTQEVNHAHLKTDVKLDTENMQYQIHSVSAVLINIFKSLKQCMLSNF